MDSSEQIRAVYDYYSTTLTNSTDLKTSACCPIDAVPESHRQYLTKIHPEVTSRFYGCGSPIPDFLTGCSVLDLGCGTGRDVYLASALVGPEGKVIGVDMSESQLAVANRYVDYHTTQFFDTGVRPNVEFRRGQIEDLSSANIADNWADVVISNCVCNLSPDKKAVFSEVARVLKDGGEFFFSDVYADRRLSQEAMRDEVLVGECLGGAMYIEDFRRVMKEVGFADLRVVSSGVVEVHHKELESLVPGVTFYSVTVRAFKMSSMEDRREDYGQSGTLVGGAESFTLDVDTIFEKGVEQAVDRNTASILQKARFKDNFKVTAGGVHRGQLTRKCSSRHPLLLSCLRPISEQSGEVDEGSSCCAPKTKRSVCGDGSSKSEGKSMTNGCKTGASVGAKKSSGCC